jgi:aspartate aminotransferase
LLDGWSKTYAMTGWRLGYSVWPKNVIAHAEKLCVNIHSCVNSSAQFAGIAALEGDQGPVDVMVSAFDERRKIIVKELNQISGFSCIEPGGAFYAFPNITGTGMTSDELQQKILEEAGVAVISGTSFGKYGEGYLRFSYANSIENIQKAIKNIRACIA